MVIMLSKLYKKECLSKLFVNDTLISKPAKNQEIGSYPPKMCKIKLLIIY